MIKVNSTREHLFKDFGITTALHFDVDNGTIGVFVNRTLRALVKNESEVLEYLNSIYDELMKTL
jgi:hypothetical protein